MNEIDETLLATAGELAKELGRSAYGVKKALKRMNVEPRHSLRGTAYFLREPALEKLGSEMRAANSKP